MTNSIYEYGVLRRIKDSDDEWKPVTGYRKTTDAYRTIGPAKAFKKALENRSYWGGKYPPNYEYKLARRKINAWEDI